MRTPAKHATKIGTAIVLAFLLVAPPAAAADDASTADADDEPCFYINPWVFPPVVYVTKDPSDCI